MCGYFVCFIHRQRKKIGDKGEIMVAAPDILESQRQAADQERRLAEGLRRERAEEKTVTVSDELLQRSEEFETDDILKEVVDDCKTINDNSSINKIEIKRNIIEIPGFQQGGCCMCQCISGKPDQGWCPPS